MNTLTSFLRFTVIFLPIIFGAGCATNWQTVSLAAGGATALAGRSPSHEVQQVYYLGIYDPEEQLPQQVYRVTVHGQASLLSQVRFASGWVPSEVVDHLGNHLEFKEGKVSFDNVTNKTAISELMQGKRQVLFGPEGFREAPRKHRLVIIMAGDPSQFFDSVTDTLSQVAVAQQQADNSNVVRELLLAWTQRSLERERLEGIREKLTK